GFRHGLDRYGIGRLRVQCLGDGSSATEDRESPRRRPRRARTARAAPGDAPSRHRRRSRDETWFGRPLV
ncbi:MAG: hypothetical protein AVDCRST_MAG19-2671, partial [uncultured Thermomicrobiales bacterium]